MNTTKHKFQAIIFDLDGTLLNTIDDLADTMNQVLNNYSFPIHSTDQYKVFVGQGIDNLILQALPKNFSSFIDFQTIKNDYVASYKNNCLNKTKPYPGIIEVISEITNKGIKTAILSNKNQDLSKKIVENFFEPDLFNIVLGETEEFPRKPDPAAALKIADTWKINTEDIIFTGDSGIDMKTAVAAGMYPVGVSWGFRGVDELESTGAEFIINKPEELLQLL